MTFGRRGVNPCKKEMPGYQRLADRYGSRGFAVIGFKFDTMMDTEDPVQFASKIGVHYPLTVATEDMRQKFGGIEGLPTTPALLLVVPVVTVAVIQHQPDACPAHLEPP